MINPLAILALAKRFWWLGLVAAIGILLAVDRHHIHQRDEARAALKQTVTNVKAATAAVYAKAAGQMLAEERRRSAINQESADEARATATALDARYSRLWAAYSAGRGGRSAQAPAVPDPARGFDAKACGDGLFCIPAQTAFGLMRAADDQTQQLLGLQDWVRKQAAVDPNAEE